MKNAFDPYALRKDFPILSRTLNDKPLVYLDNASTSQKPEAMLKRLNDYYRTHNANVHRAVHILGQEATRAEPPIRKPAFLPGMPPKV